MPVDPEPLEVVESRAAVQIADPVAVRVGERAQVDLVEDVAHGQGKLPGAE